MDYNDLAMDSNIIQNVIFLYFEKKELKKKIARDITN